jgi:Flp pilus assembly protein TadG
VEFAIVAIPFFMLIFGVIGIGLYFFTANALENGVETAARKIRTGEAQKSDLTVDGFRDLVCSATGTYINCDKLSVVVQSAGVWGDIVPQPCLDADGNIVPSTGSEGEKVSKYTGMASQVVLVTLCYQWDLAESFGFLNFGANSDGSGAAILQAATAFRTEPYS